MNRKLLYPKGKSEVKDLAIYTACQTFFNDVDDRAFPYKMRRYLEHAQRGKLDRCKKLCNDYTVNHLFEDIALPDLAEWTLGFAKEIEKDIGKVFGNVIMQKDLEAMALHTSCANFLSDNSDEPNAPSEKELEDFLRSVADDSKSSKRMSDIKPEVTVVEALEDYPASEIAKAILDAKDRIAEDMGRVVKQRYIVRDYHDFYGGMER